MSKPFEEELRRQIVQAVMRGEKQRVVAERFGIGLRTVERYISRWRENGQIARGKFGGHRKPTLLKHQELVEKLVEAHPDWSLKRLREALDEQGVQIGITALHNFLHRIGVVYNHSGGRTRTSAQRRQNSNCQNESRPDSR